MAASTISAGDLKTAFLATPRGEWGRFCSHLGPDARKQFAGYVRDVLKAMDERDDAGQNAAGAAGSSARATAKHSSSSTHDHHRGGKSSKSVRGSNKTVLDVASDGNMALEVREAVLRRPRKTSSKELVGMKAASTTSSKKIGARTLQHDTQKSQVVDTDPTKILKGGRAAAPAFPPASSARMSRGGPAFLFSVDLDAVLQKKREKLAAALGKKSVRGKLATIPEEDGEPGAATTSSKAATSTATQLHKFLVAAPRPAENLVQELRDFIRVSLYLKGDDRLQFAIAQSGEIRKQVVINLMTGPAGK